MFHSLAWLGRGVRRPSLEESPGSSTRRSRQALVVLTGIVGFGTVVLCPIERTARAAGPGQPEVQSFEPVTTTELVNPFTGDLTYNIPLMDIGGYPLNLVYQSGITMDQEASFVGLGWNLNAGVILRNVRGLPDDFAGEEITKEVNLKDNVTTGARVGVGLELFGYDGALSVAPGVSVGGNYNTYRGPGVDFGLSASVSAGEGAKTSATLGLGLSSNSGVSVNPSISFSAEAGSTEDAGRLGGSLGLRWDSREGLKDLTFRATYESNWAKGGDKAHAGGMRFSFADPTYTPEITIPMRNSSLSLGLKLGGEIFGTTGTVDVGGYDSKQEVAEPLYRIPAYGYLYAHRAGDATRVLHDFNRENDGSFVPTQPNLPLAHMTYDLYAVSGQGLQAQFRPFRSDVGSLFDHEVDLSGAAGDSVAVDLAGGNSLKVGADVVITHISSRAGPWQVDNPAYARFRFKGEVENNPAYEPVYFRQVGETTRLSPERHSLFNSLGGRTAVRLQLNGQSVVPELIQGPSLSPPPVPPPSPIPLGSYIAADRQPRNVHFSFLTAAEASEAGLERDLRTYIRPLETYDFGPGLITRFDPIPRVDADGPDQMRLPHHISEITVTRDDGTRYIYGLPLYTHKEEVTFNVSGRMRGGTGASRDLERAQRQGIIEYEGGERGEASLNNQQGRNHYYERTITPPHAYAYYLTAIVSPDYVDRMGDGPTPDDFGTYTKFNYRRHAERHSWRAPTSESGKAFYQEGHHSDGQDDLASYVHGWKEIWYLASIETKNYIAEFTLSNREDAVGVASEHGGLGSQRLQKLDSIRLFNRAERLNQGDGAVPIKTVHFVYDYSLTRGMPDSLDGKGKLTLRKVAFSYRTSEKAAMSPYEFTYSSDNPNYDLQASDRWGTYKQNTAGRPNRRFPYTRQDPFSDSAAAARAWHLTSVRLPSGGKLSVEYESDDYAYVQNRRAQILVPIIHTAEPTTTGRDCRPSPPGPTTTTLGQLYGPGTSQNYLCFYFQLLEPLHNDEPGRTALREYVRGMGELFVNAEVEVDASRELHEVVQAFVPVALDEEGIPRHGFDQGHGCGENCFTRGWILLQAEDMRKSGLAREVGGSELIHPLTQAAWQYLKRDVPQIAYRDPMPDPFGDGENVLETISRVAQQLADNIREAVDGIFVVMKDAQRAKRFRLNRSFMRLNHTAFKKLGGGSRVRKVTLSDEWAGMIRRPSESNLTQSYVLEYDYTMADDVGGRSMRISSGVASYEPLLGGDENPFFEPIWYEHNGDHLFQRGPIGESAFPSPVVGYRQVTVKQRAPPAPAGQHIAGTGSTVYEFYTAKDFPVVVKRTPVHMERSNPVALMSPFPFSQDHVAVSQGYVVELNDMHGKPKATWVYPEGSSTPLSGVTYHYMTDPEQTVPTMVAPNVIRERPLGVEFDAFVDFREHQTVVKGPGVQLNLDGFLAAIIPVLIPMPYPEYSRESTRFRSAVVTKIIHRSSPIKTTRAYESSANLATHNKLWDGETGQVIVTATETAHGTCEATRPPIACRYTTAVPAHLEHEGMSGAWENQGLELLDVRVDGTGKLLGEQAWSYLYPGDELLLTPIGASPEGLRAWVWQRVSGTWFREWGAILLDRNGRHIPPSRYASAKVIRSGRRNQQAVSLGHVTSMQSPIVESRTEPTAKELRFSDVIDAAAVEFAEHWQTYGPYALRGRARVVRRVTQGELLLENTWVWEGPHFDCGVAIGAPVNPFVEGILGNWRPRRTLSYVADRTASQRIREAGIYETETFEPFWTVFAGRDTANWQWFQESTIIDPFGRTLETRDALGRYQAELSGHDFSAVTAAAANARPQQIATDSFEDYLYANRVAFSGECPNPTHWNFKEAARAGVGQIDTAQRHTGRKSFRVTGHVTVSRALEGSCNPDTRAIPTGNFYRLQRCDLISAFSPQRGHYVLGAWVKTGRPGEAPHAVPVEGPTIEVIVDGRSTRLRPEGLAVDGWQRIEKEFEVPRGASSVDVTLHSGTGVIAWFDDLRIHPKNAHMKTYVYDPIDLRFRATLDTDNYATLYDYDEEGALSRLKLETERGIMTTKEVSRAAPKVP